MSGATTDARPVVIVGGAGFIGSNLARSFLADGHRVLLVTCPRGEMGDIVAKERDTPYNHRRLAELRAVELENAMGELGVTEHHWLGHGDGACAEWQRFQPALLGLRPRFERRSGVIRPTAKPLPYLRTTMSLPDSAATFSSRWRTVSGFSVASRPTS